MKKLLLLLLIVLSAFFVAACIDTEEQVTCQGLAEAELEWEIALAEAAEMYEITYSSVRLGKDEEGISAFVVAVVENIGESNLHVYSGYYDLLDGDDAILTKGQFNCSPKVIAPGEKAYYCSERSLEELENIDAVLTLDASFDIVKTPEESVCFEFSEAAIEINEEAAYYKITASGFVENTTAKDCGRFGVTFILLNDNNEPINFLCSFSSDLAAGEKEEYVDYSFTLPASFSADDYAGHIVIAYPIYW